MKPSRSIENVNEYNGNLLPGPAVNPAMEFLFSNYKGLQENNSESLENNFPKYADVVKKVRLSNTDFLSGLKVICNNLGRFVAT